MKNMKKVFLSCLLLTLLPYCRVLAEELEKNIAPYYLKMGLGLGLPFTARLFGDLNATQSITIQPPLGQLIHIYLPFFSDKLLIGVGFEFWDIIVKEKKITTLPQEKLDKTTLNTIITIFEGQYFFDYICHGWFLNVGIGDSLLSIKKGNPWTTTDTNIESSGISYKFGVGYAFSFLNQFNKKYLAALIIGAEGFYTKGTEKDKKWKIINWYPYFSILF